MLEFFTKYIKPQNEALGRSLNIKKTIPVTHASTAHIVPVLLKYKTTDGRTVTVKSTEVSFKRSLGLLV